MSNGAQAWAESEAEDLTLKHSCTTCSAYSEILAKRRSSRKLPVGVEAAEWVWGNWFGDEDDRTYAAILDDPNLHSLGIGVSYIRAPDRTYHMYVVGRFSS